ncbi:nicotinate mononucleotide-dependent phosphoribosyltransferase CobT [Halalkalicoccus sp. NIPERK01]|uniref:nicotinate mononucleotide-dependent phosphoribosyltransferase CobT n=1 Tax=Halalkalicoccus sp. NIPERK01 TaxID=3053469 RepID=UPI00256EB217|nr:TIGR00303 family protein [Halalkalicoccus sp. NIPERK01]MDL5363105.1 TIGR00303 family protein [Halalkalicoccus sp. NIPERK01]
MRFVLVGGNTDTARIDGISAAGANPDAMIHTPSADLEIVEYGHPVQAPVVPVSPTGCPTPAVVTRAVRELLGFDVLAVDAGLARPTTAPTVTIGDGAGRDIRTSDPVASASETFEAARRLGRCLPDAELVIGETIPGGTTTALGVLTALGEQPTVSSSLPENPLSLKRDVVSEALGTSGLSPGSTAGNPIETVQCVGDPVLAAVAGLTTGATATGTTVTLAGGTQLAAAAALVRHAGTDVSLSLATTSFLAADDTAGIHDLANDLDVNLTTDPGFDTVSHPAMDAYVAGEAKEGVGMGGALALADAADVSMAIVREKIADIYDRLVSEDRTMKI